MPFLIKPNKKERANGPRVGQPFNELYCGAKFAVEGFTEALASYITDYFNVHFSIIEPGGIISEFMNSAVEKTKTEGKMAHPDYMPLLEKYLSGIQKRSKHSEEQVYQTPQQVAKVILEVITSDNPPIRKRTSPWAENFTHIKTQADPDGHKLKAQIKADML